MSRWTNDKWVSTPHRVVCPPADKYRASNRRQSMAFFVSLQKDQMVECIPTCLDGDTQNQQPKYVCMYGWMDVQIQLFVEAHSTLANVYPTNLPIYVSIYVSISSSTPQISTHQCHAIFVGETCCCYGDLLFNSNLFFIVMIDHIDLSWIYMSFFFFFNLSFIVIVVYVCLLHSWIDLEGCIHNNRKGKSRDLSNEKGGGG